MENSLNRESPYRADAAAAKSLQSCPTLCDPIDGSPPGSVPGSLQARTLEWVAISFSHTRQRAGLFTVQYKDSINKDNASLQGDNVSVQISLDSMETKLVNPKGN